MRINEFYILSKDRIFNNLKNFSIWFFLLGIVIITGFLSTAFFRQSNIVYILQETVIVGVVGIGMTYVIISGCFDLSAGAILGLCTVISLTLKPGDTWSTILAIVIPICAGAAFGLVNGVLVGYLKMNAFITTLGMQYLILGITLFYTHGNHVAYNESSEFFYAIGNKSLGGIPISVIILIALVTIAQLILSYTNFGQYLKMVGENSKAATLSGINVSWTRCLGYVFLGVCAAISGIILASWVRNLDPASGLGYEFQAITVAILGGTSLFGGKGNIFNTFAGALIFVMIVNAMLLIDISYNFQLMIRGIILIAGVTVGVIYAKKDK
jgi:ribose/xylose/arabinose/galactoside ABC-type transport system permease subunit